MYKIMALIFILLVGASCKKDTAEIEKNEITDFLIIQGSTFEGYEPYFKLGQVSLYSDKKCTKYHWSMGYRVQKYRSKSVRVDLSNNFYSARVPINITPEGDCGWVIKSLSVGLNNVLLFTTNDSEAVRTVLMRCKYIGGNVHPSNQYRCSPKFTNGSRKLKLVNSEIEINFELETIN